MRRGERGQAAVELLGTLPLILAVAIAAAQLLAVGYSSVLAGNAAEAGALALAGGGDAHGGSRGAAPVVAARAGSRQMAARCGCGLWPPTLLRALAGEFEVTGRAAVEP